MATKPLVVRTAVTLLTCAALAACGTTVSGVGAGSAGGAPDGVSTTGSASVGSGGTTPSGITAIGSQPGAGMATAVGAGATTTGATTTGPTVSGGVVGNSSSIPLTGPGWDAKNVYVGVPTADDFNGAAKSAGANLNNGSFHGDVDAIIADINKAGGVLGRTVVAAYHDTSTVALTSNPSSTAESMCTYFTQDRPVIAVINGAPQLDAQEGFHRCLEQKKVSLLSFANTDYNDQDYSRLGPHLFTIASLSTDLVVPSFVAALNRQTFFTGWNTTVGAAGTAPVRVGILLPDTAAGHHVDQLLRANLKGIGVTVAADFFYDPSGAGSKSQAEVLKFTSAKVTHVLDLPPIAAEVYLFQGAAEQQRYRPRYGFTSFNLPLSTEENSSIAPAAQQIGSMGIGWQPYNDTNASHDYGPLPGSKRCFAALAAGQQKFNGSSRRAALIAVQFCDALYLLRDAIVAGHGFTGADILRSMPIAGPKLLSALTFQSTLSSTNHGLPGYYVDQEYRKDCSCFVYVGGKHPFSRTGS